MGHLSTPEMSGHGQEAIDTKESLVGLRFGKKSTTTTPFLQTDQTSFENGQYQRLSITW
jgi:hypothetical protein